MGDSLAGVVALAYPEVLYQGFGNVNAILEARGGDYAPLLLLQIVAAKIVTTSVCQRSGLVGGVYAPSIFMGEHRSAKSHHTLLLPAPLTIQLFSEGSVYIQSASARQKRHLGFSGRVFIV